MPNISNRDAQVVAHLIEHCHNVQDDISFIGTYEQLERDPRTQRSLICSILQIGELVKEELSLEFRAENSDIPWESIIAMRHKLVHHYAVRKLDVVWTTATESVPMLLAVLSKYARVASFMDLGGKKG